MMNIFIRGFLYGILSIIPGLSGGVLALKFGDYNKCISIVTRKDISFNNVLYLLLIIFGFVLGVYILSSVILNLYLKFTLVFKIIIVIINFYLIKELVLELKISYKLLIILVLLTIIFVLIFKIVNLSIHVHGTLIYIICGLMYAAGKIIPGLSVTSFYINIDFYDDILRLFSSPFITISSSPLNWTLFIIFMFLDAYLFIHLIYKYKEKFNYIVIVILIVNTVNLII